MIQFLFSGLQFANTDFPVCHFFVAKSVSFLTNT